MMLDENTLKQLASYMQEKGKNGDTILAHINPEEAMLLKQLGGAGTVNPETGLLQFYRGDAEGTRDSDGRQNDTPGSSRDGNGGGLQGDIDRMMAGRPDLFGESVSRDSFADAVSRSRYGVPASSLNALQALDIELTSALYGSRLGETLSRGLVNGAIGAVDPFGLTTLASLADMFGLADVTPTGLAGMDFSQSAGSRVGDFLGADRSHGSRDGGDGSTAVAARSGGIGGPVGSVAATARRDPLFDTDSFFSKAFPAKRSAAAAVMLGEDPTNRQPYDYSHLMSVVNGGNGSGSSGSKTISLSDIANSGHAQHPINVLTEEQKKALRDVLEKFLA